MREIAGVVCLIPFVVFILYAGYCGIKEGGMVAIKAFVFATTIVGLMLVGIQLLFGS